MECTNAIKFHRKSGVAQRRDLQFNGPFLEMFSTEWEILFRFSPETTAARRTERLCHAA
jgi:hypothetical protein